MLQFQSQNGPDHVQAQSVQAQSQSQPPSSMQTLRLRDDPQPLTPTPPRSRKRKTPPANPSADQQQQQGPPPQQHMLPPPHTLVHMSTLPPFYQASDYSTAGITPPQPGSLPVADMQAPQSPGDSSNSRSLSSSKRAEQNRKAQRAFRERRDQHVKALESRSQLLDAALASADEANRRWEECRTLVDQLRVENAALRAELSQMQMVMNSGGGGNNGAQHSEEPRAAGMGTDASAETTSRAKETKTGK